MKETEGGISPCCGGTVHGGGGGAGVRPGVWFLGEAWKWLGRRRKLLAQCRRNMAGLLMGWAADGLG